MTFFRKTPQNLAKQPNHLDLGREWDEKRKMHLSLLDRNGFDNTSSAETNITVIFAAFNII